MPIIGKEWFTDVAKQQPMVLFEDISQGCERFVVPVYSNPRFFMDSSLFDNFKYTSRIIDVAGQLASRSASPTFMCQCAGQCSMNCECSSGVFGEGGTVEDMELLMWDTVRECNEYCNCALWCGNRVAQKGAMYPVEIFARDPWCGWGVRASVDIPLGTFIGEYAGELIDDEEAMDRHDSTFLFETKVGSETLTIDAKYSGNYTRFINHSCAPNVKVANISWDYDKIQLIHMCFFTDKAIEKGEELTIDYGEAWWANKKFPCLCKSSECRYQFGKEQRN